MKVQDYLINIVGINVIKILLYVGNPFELDGNFDGIFSSAVLINSGVSILYLLTFSDPVKRLGYFL